MIELQVNTTQNVNIKFVAASLGERILAFLIDYTIIIAYTLFAMYMLPGVLPTGLDQWQLTAIYSLVLLPAMFYTLVSEYIMNGQTLGKRVMRIKVVKIDGYQAVFIEFVLRWVFRLIDIFLAFGTGSVAILSIAMSTKSQRLGDIATGTAVISLKDKAKIDHTILEESEEGYTAQYPSVINLSDKDMQIIKNTFNVASQNNDYQTIAKLSQKVQSITKTNQALKTDVEYLRIIMKDYTYLTKDM